jgi:hypothetical protein
MFGYAKKHTRGYLEEGYEAEEVQGDIEAIRKQVRGLGVVGLGGAGPLLLERGLPHNTLSAAPVEAASPRGAAHACGPAGPPLLLRQAAADGAAAIPGAAAGKAAVVDAAVAWVEAAIAADRKVGGRARRAGRQRRRAHAKRGRTGPSGSGSPGAQQLIGRALSTARPAAPLPCARPLARFAVPSSAPPRPLRAPQIGALKQLQGHVWRKGFASGDLVAQIFRDVPDALAEWRNAGIKTYIYSSGSREAQRQFFGHTQVGRRGQHAASSRARRHAGPAFA